MKRIVFLFALFTLVLAACSPSSGDAPAPAQSASGEFDINNWDSVLTAAKGQTVNWYLWGGSDSINAFVDNFYGKALQERYGITLNRIPVADTVDAVNQVLSEKQAGTDPGVVDLIWINGENFFTNKQTCYILTGPRNCPTANMSTGTILPSTLISAPRWTTWKARGHPHNSNLSMTQLA